jgi:hypothetical protein
MEILQNNPTTKGRNGVYSIRVGNTEKRVYCDMSIDGGGWTVSRHWSETDLTLVYRKHEEHAMVHVRITYIAYNCFGGSNKHYCQ